MNYRAIIFDLDGVICHTDQYHYRAWKVVADRLGIAFDEQINNRLRGVSRMESLEIVLENYSGSLTKEQKLALAEEKNKRYCELLGQMSPSDLSEEVKTTLEELRADGLLLAIGSSSRNTPLILDKLGLTGFFDAISDGNNITNSKPDPEVFTAAASMLGVAAQQCLVVEDAVAGLEAAKAGGMDAAAIGDAVKSPLADYRLSQFSDLNKL